MRIFLQKVYRKLLQLTFRFEKWHISPLSERPYALDIISFSNNQIKKDAFGEIGCGLGDIIRHVNFSRKYGYDIDGQVLKAARFLTGKNNTSFEIFNFPSSALKPTFNILVLVNWIHHIEPATLREKLEEYFEENLQPGGMVIIDTVQDPAYKYNHQLTFLTEKMDCSIEKIGEYARQREVWAIKKTNNI